MALAQFELAKKTEMRSGKRKRSPSPLRQTKLAFPSTGTSTSLSASHDKLIMDFIIASGSALNILDIPEFKRMCQGLTNNPNLPILGRKKCRLDISAQFTQKKDEIRKKLQTIEYVCTTADIWSCSTRSFLGMTCHWIEPATLERKSVVLACKLFKGAHTYDKVGNLIFNIHNEFNLNIKKITKTITDNGSNMVKAFSCFPGKGIESSEAESDGSDDEDDIVGAPFPETAGDVDIELPSHERCMAHTLNLVATLDLQKAINKSCIKKKYTSVAGKVQALFNKVGRSPKAMNSFVSFTKKKLKYHAQLGGAQHL